MRIRFTKMQGAGNDFVVLDETQARHNFSSAQYRFLADRHFGVGADQILTVRPAPNPSLDFEYVIHNADGGEVEHCGNGARCFVRYVRDKGLTTKDRVRVKVKQGEIELHMQFGCVFLNAVPAKPWLAARALAQRWWQAFAWACSTPSSMCKRTAACSPLNGRAVL